jgi:hypothetical protein
MINFKYLLSLKIPKVCALVAASMLLPALAYADHDNGKWNKDDKDEHRWSDHDTDNGKWNKGDKDEHRWNDHDTEKGRDKGIPAVPETNAGWVLVPFLGAVLLFSAREPFRPRAAQK